MTTLSRRSVLAGIAGLSGLALGGLDLGQSAQASVAAPTGTAATGLHISGGRLVEGNGSAFVLRGVSAAHNWYADKTTQSLKDIKALGANSVRIVLSTGARWTKNDASDVANVISQCKANKLICILEAHDTTGYGEQSGAISLSQAADYWIGIKSALQGQEAYTIVNIGNEPYGNSNTSGWVADTKGAIQKLRNAGITQTLMVDAPCWGQDWDGTMKNNAASVASADSQQNTLFSVHMYGVYDTASEITSYLNSFVSAGLPIAVGEFGNQHTDGNPDEDTIMATAQQLGIGYLGWSWSGNSSDVAYLDMVNGFNGQSLTSWGERIFHGANGISSTARQATVYN
ncbi:glycoside hydrolase family 5 protein [Streptomyces odontomachi]|uniref:glycoside hydrolase family 5 protein n=1 Tax=Streptomyces odontomachi TaxID=2944940 RepID=UPI00210B1693|nr:glycoside hydrolase family 5 protein [Streptomyces sp. ODS25]